MTILGPVAYTVYRLVTGWVARGSNPSGGAKFSATVQTGPGAHPASCTIDTAPFHALKSGRGVTLTLHPLLVPWSRRVHLYFYSPYGPYGLYRASVSFMTMNIRTCSTVLRHRIIWYEYKRLEDHAVSVFIAAPSVLTVTISGRLHH